VTLAILHGSAREAACADATKTALRRHLRASSFVYDRSTAWDNAGRPLGSAMSTTTTWQHYHGNELDWWEEQRHRPFALCIEFYENYLGQT
jgi:hypothetical protein